MAVLAGILFGASVPLSKVMLGSSDPLMLAALLYLGSGLGMVFMRLLLRTGSRPPSESGLKRADAPWLLGALAVGGVVAPIVLMLSLKTTPSSTAALLLNFEAVGTVLIAALMFREPVGRRVWLALGLLTAGGVVLSLKGGGWGISIGALGIIAACSLWGLDNNLTRNISARDPTEIVAVKGLGAGLFSLILAVSLSRVFPELWDAVSALLIGFVCYGLSLYLYVMALRGLGAARAGALFAVAPFSGAALGMLMFRESPTEALAISLPLMAAGAFLLFSEAHGHPHRHRRETHDHRHSHSDGHHSHPHPPDTQETMHSHSHEHEVTEHEHPHSPDIHHRHSH